MDRNEWYREQYALEWAQRAHLFDLTRFCMLGTTVVGTVLAAAAHSFNYAAPGWVVWAFVALLGLSALSLLAGLVYIGRSLLGQRYGSPPQPSQLEATYAEILQRLADDSSRDELEGLFRDKLGLDIAAVAEANFKANQARERLVRRALWCLAWSLVPLVIAAPFYIGSMLALP